ncbi:hypothetical protein IGI04_018904 [Brassica rapa subsp. trilocularis]|uniref:DHHA1 domain-containing protein n=1 Tax=Brassica rapa subsp. trilocularis TaxID=1813537 RepID=A0ABQ7MGQ5_BRACM|nr:hypothetical protein IGI04_018904 [Brassica rapa subsp. trilocularis]
MKLKLLLFKTEAEPEFFRHRLLLLSARNFSSLSSRVNFGVVEKKKAVLYHYPCHDCVFAALTPHLYFSANSIPSLTARFCPASLSQRRQCSHPCGIEDADIWKWELPGSKAFNSGIVDLGIEYDLNQNQTLFQKLLSLDHESVINRGRESLSRKHKLIQEALEQSYEIVLGGDEEFGWCLAVNADENAELRSELGNQLAEKRKRMRLRGVGAVVYRVPELEDAAKLKISLRSVAEEDTTQVSQRFGGGGHKNASSLLLSSVELEQWKVKRN